MNIKQQIVNRTKALQLLDKCYNKDIDCIKISTANTREHEMKKCEVCYNILEEGGHFVTEAHFAGGRGRADVIDLDNAVAIEIVCSEKEASLLNKEKKYPIPFYIIKVEK